jgi:hypothetical protein
MSRPRMRYDGFCVGLHSCLCVRERCCVHATLVRRHISVLACMHEARGKVQDGALLVYVHG